MPYEEDTSFTNLRPIRPVFFLYIFQLPCKKCFLRDIFFTHSDFSNNYSTTSWGWVNISCGPWRSMPVTRECLVLVQWLHGQWSCQPCMMVINSWEDYTERSSFFKSFYFFCWFTTKSYSLDAMLNYKIVKPVHHALFTFTMTMASSIY